MALYSWRFDQKKGFNRVGEAIRHELKLNSPSGGVKKMERSFSNLDNRCTHWWNVMSSISIAFPRHGAAAGDHQLGWVEKVIARLTPPCAWLYRSNLIVILASRKENRSIDSSQNPWSHDVSVGVYLIEVVIRDGSRRQTTHSQRKSSLGNHSRLLSRRPSHS